MKERRTLKCAVFLLMTKMVEGKEYILLQHRYHTGIQDNRWDVAASGHLDPDETIREAMIREAKEEIGIELNARDLTLVNTMFAKFTKSEYTLLAFHTTKWKNEPSIMEPEKCDGLKWVPIDDLPEEIITNRKMMIDAYLASEPYLEYDKSKDPNA